MKYLKDFALQAFPNPFIDRLTIEAVGTTICIPFEVISSSGEIVYHGLFSEKTTINTASFPEDIYFLRYKNNRKYRFVKLHKGKQQITIS